MSNDRKQTVRQEIIRHLESGPMTIRNLSQSVGIMEKDVCDHLEFIEKTIRRQKKRMETDPYTCLSCGFEFKRRKRFSKPGKCPECKNSRISQAVFRIISKNG